MLLEGEMKLDSKEETQADTGGTYQTTQSNKTQAYDQTGNIGAVSVLPIVPSRYPWS